MRQHQSGMSLLEFTLVVLIVSVLAAVFLNALTSLRAQIERTAVEQTLNQMRSALAARFAELYIAGDDEAIAEWAGGNALALLRGDYDLEDPRTGEPSDPAGPGEWAYEDGEIVYRPVFAEAIGGEPDAAGRWEVVVQGTPDDPRGLALRTVEPLIEDEAAEQKGAE